jgi:photosystem II stability/assembly factor-like uncharacterized protein
MKKLIQVFLWIIFPASISLLNAQLITGKNFKEISDGMNDYYNRVGKNKPGYKQFKRWEWYHSTRQSPDGKLVDNFRMNSAALRAVDNNINLAQANSGAWTSLGPSSVSSTDKGIGRVNRIAFHPTNENILYAATATGGLWITTDGGSNWYSYSEGIPNMTLSGVAVDHTNPNILYILTGDADSYFTGARGQFEYGKASIGVLKSYDGGFTWQQTALQWNETAGVIGYKLMIHPTNSNILFVATNQGIYRTNNGGTSWDSTQTDIYVYDMEFRPGTPSTIYASGKTADSIVVLKSTNTGVSFNQTHAIDRVNDANGNGSANRAALAVSPANSSYVYLLTGPSTAPGQFHGFFRSIDAGESFTLRTSSPNILGRSSLGTDGEDQEGYDLCAVVSPTNINTIACGGIYLWTSTNGGSVFSYEDPSVSSISYYHADIHDLAYHPLNSSRMYMCADGGIYLSVDNGDNWIAINNNLQVTQYYKISINQGTGFGAENIAIGGTQDNGTNKRSSAGGSSYTKISGGDGMDNFIDPDGLSTYVASIQNGEFKNTTNAGSSFGFVCNEETLETELARNIVTRWVTPVAEVAGGTLQFIMGYRPVVKTTVIGSGLYSFAELGWSGLTFVKTARGNANRLYVGDNDYGGYNLVKTTTNGGADWTTVLDQPNTLRMTDLAFAATNGNRIWITYGGYDATKKVIYTADGGTSWTNITGSLPNVPVNCIIYETSSGSNDGIYIGTDIGVFYRNNTLGDWVPFSNGLPVVEVTDLEIHESEGLLRAGTYGRGLWETSLFSACPSTMTLNTSNTRLYMPYSFQVSSGIASTAVHSGTGANVFYKAGSNIVLSPGFQSTGNIFKASIGPCGGGVPSVINKTNSNDTVLNQVNTISHDVVTDEIISAVKSDSQVGFKLEISRPGNYEIKVYDFTNGSYLAETAKLSCSSKGTYSLGIKLSGTTSLIMRADLFRDGQLLHKLSFD